VNKTEKEHLIAQAKGEVERLWEELGGKKHRYVTLPSSLLEALYDLQKEPRGLEWGGGIDFEIIKDEPQVERVLAYLGEKGTVPYRVVKKYGSDVEVIFHTHPRQRKVQPSPADILSFLQSPAQVELIIAGEEIALFEKTPKFRFETLKGIELKIPAYYSPKIAMPEIIRKLAKIGIDTYIFPKKEASPVFDLNIIRQVTEKI